MDVWYSSLPMWILSSSVPDSGCGADWTVRNDALARVQQIDHRHVPRDVIHHIRPRIICIDNDAARVTARWNLEHAGRILRIREHGRRPCGRIGLDFHNDVAGRAKYVA